MSTSRSAYGETSGTGSREARPLMQRLMAFSLRDEIEALRSEEQWLDGDRNSRTLAKDVDFRVLLTVLHDGATLDEQDGDARVSIQPLEGRVQLTLDGQSTDIAAGGLAVVDAGQRWDLRATGDCAVLLTLAWPREKAGI
jgi:quercetin dioxygenase-like cupin family protein